MLKKTAEFFKENMVGIILGSLITTILMALFGYIYVNGNIHSFSYFRTEDLGSFGSFFGGLLAPVAALATLYWLSKSFDMQKITFLQSKKDSLMTILEAQCQTRYEIKYGIIPNNVFPDEQQLRCSIRGNLLEVAENINFAMEIFEDLSRMIVIISNQVTQESHFIPPEYNSIIRTMEDLIQTLKEIDDSSKHEINDLYKTEKKRYKDLLKGLETIKKLSINSHVLQTEHLEKINRIRNRGLNPSR